MTQDTSGITYCQYKQCEKTECIRHDKYAPRYDIIYKAAQFMVNGKCIGELYDNEEKDKKDIRKTSSRKKQANDTGT